MQAMRIQRAITGGIGALLAGAALAVVLAAPAGAAEPETILVKLRPWVGYLQGSGAPVAERWIEVASAPGETIDEALAAWAARPEVEAVEPNLEVRAAPQRAVPVTTASTGDPDPLAGYQWHLDDVQAAAARVRGDGGGAVVAVLDTGITRGEDLACHTLVDPYDAITRQAGADDTSGHGTHVAGTIAQCTGNGIGVAGMAPGVQLMPVRVLDRFGSGDFADLAVGIDWARAHGADVINLSLGGSCEAAWPECGSTAVDEAIARAAADGIVLVASVGNEGKGYPDFPANHPDVLGVGAVETRRLRPAYSNAGPDLAAPGGEAGVDRNADGTIDGVIQESFSGGAWGYWARAGTSFAAPHVAGAAALLRSLVPTASAADVRGALQCTAADLGPAGPDDEYGHGLLQADAAAAALAAGVWDTTAPVFAPGATVSAAVAGEGGRLQLSWPTARDCDTIDRYSVSRDGEPVGEFSATTAATAGTGTYEVRAVDRAGNVSSPLRVEWAPPQVLAGGATGELPGLVDPDQGRWYLYAADGAVDAFYYGNPGDVPFLGDWDCDGVATPGLYRRADGYVYLRNANTAGVAHLSFFFGDPGDVPLAGDFDGDGCDTVGIYRPAEARVYVINRLGDGDRGLGDADYSYTLGDPDDVPLVADVDGDGVDEVSLARPGTQQVFLRNELAAGPVDSIVGVGDPGDVALLADWDADGSAEPGVWRPSGMAFHLPGGALAAPWAASHWLPVVGATGG